MTNMFLVGLQILVIHLLRASLTMKGEEFFDQLLFHLVKQNSWGWGEKQKKLPSSLDSIDSGRRCLDILGGAIFIKQIMERIVNCPETSTPIVNIGML